MKIVCIGHSIVCGYPFPGQYAFPRILERKLDGNNQVMNRGINGESTREILMRFKSDAILEKPDLIFMMAGTNDYIFSTAKPEESFSDCMEMEKISRAAGIRLIHMTPLPINIEQAAFAWPATSREDYVRVEKEIKQFVSMLINASDRHEIELLDTFDGYEKYAEFVDGLHPTREGQELIAEMCINYLRRKALTK